MLQFLEQGNTHIFDKLIIILTLHLRELLVPIKASFTVS